MKRLIIGASRFWFCLCFLIPCTAVAQKLPSSETAPQNGPENNFLAAVRWRVEGKQGHLRCEVSQTSGVQDRSFIRLFTIFREEDDRKLVKIFAFKTLDSLLNVYPLGDYNARLFTTWVGGSAYHIRVFAFVDGQVKQVLDEGTRIAPEFLYDDQGRESVLITEAVMEDGKWTATNGSTTVFKWNGRAYEKIGTVPRAKRLQCLSTKACESLK